MKLAVIKIRGNVKVKGNIVDTMKLMNLTRINHCVLIEDTNENKGMLQKAKDYITMGTIDESTLINLIEKRGKFAGDVKVTEEELQKRKLPKIKEIAKQVLEGKNLKEFKIKRVFRLSPPKKGHNSTKKSFTNGGALGNRKEKINELILKMI
ncbi:MAG: 50S ribosomal protein L30 [Candidatus Diapherotrites archaeon]|nr:50S ribosomal protein L30 [Candidatus Diapherotrites archaeon]